MKLFELGSVVATRGFLSSGISEDEARKSLEAHQSGDWGILLQADKDENSKALEFYYRIFSKYKARNGKYFYIITEADRSVTTLLLPEEY